jgi:acyl carrier protein
VAIWSQVLEVATFSVRTRILDACDSLAATRCLSRVRDAFGLTIPIGALFDEVTNIAELAVRIDTARDPDGTG